MLIPSKTVALRKLREAVSALALDCKDENVAPDIGWIGSALDEVIQLDDPSFYLDAYTRGVVLAREGLTIAKSDEVAAVVRDLPAAAGTSEDMREPTGRLIACMATLTRLLASSKDPAVSDYLDRVIAWENEYYAALAPDLPPADTSAGRADITAQSLGAYLKARWPEAKDLVVKDIRPLPGGFSKRTILFVTEDSTRGEQSFVIRAEKLPRLVYLDGSEIKHEYALVKYLRDSGLPVADVEWLETDTDLLGAPFMVSRRSVGANPGIGVAAMRNLQIASQKNLMATLARIHGTKADLSDPTLAQSHIMPWVKMRSLREMTMGWITYWKEQLDRCGCPTTPNIERAYAWLMENVPDDDVAPTIVHGDYTLGNILMENDEVTAVLDWELSFFGDPAYDFTSVMHSYDPEIIQFYVDAGGQYISEERYNYYIIFKTLKSIPLLTALSQVEHRDAKVDFYMLFNYIVGIVSHFNDTLKLFR